MILPEIRGIHADQQRHSAAHHALTASRLRLNYAKLRTASSSWKTESTEQHQLSSDPSRTGR
jgi:hypothetical protein